jgi:hypothetical protein
MNHKTSFTQIRASAYCIALVLLTSFASAQVASNSAPSNFVGTWNVFLTSDTGVVPPFGLLLQLGGDGNASSTENDEFAVSKGVWKQLDKQSAAVTLYQYDFGALQTPYQGTFKVRATLTTSNNSEKISARFHLELFDPDGNLLLTDTGKFVGNRVHVQLMP